jgi:GTPase SAR1 family protein
MEPTGPPETMNLPPVVERIAQQTDDNPAPICVLVVGMAGSGKTTLMTQLQESTMPETTAEEEEERYRETTAATAQEDEAKPAAAASSKTGKAEMPAYCINLDPATLDVPYGASIDIRDTVDYKQVMAQHNLGPNGAIMTSLNLYATKFDQVIHILEKRAEEKKLPRYLLVDTPGQIEAFTWSASGQILSESLASTFPTVMVFVVDTVRCASSPNTFMSNMLYACSMYYRTRLPLVICFNKIDVVSHEFCMEWMKDYEAFQEALDNARTTEGGDGGGFYDSLTRSLSLVLDEFYHSFEANAVGVSAVTGDGIPDFWRVIQQAAKVDFGDYVEDLKHRIAEQEAKKVAMARMNARRLQRDVDNHDDTNDFDE